MTPSGPYKSWLMNAALRQARRVQAAATLRWRQIAGGLSFTAQAAFYPLYAALQSIRLVSRRLGGSGLDDRVLSPGAEADAAIGSVLSIAQQYAAESVWVSAQAIELDEDLDADLWRDRDAALASKAPASLEPIASPSVDLGARSGTPDITRRVSTQIQAIASQLSNRALVLIDAQNQAIVLTHDQQYALQRHITEINAMVAYRRRQTRLSPAPNLLARWQTWMETGVVAQGFNLFGESQIPLPSRGPSVLTGDPRFLALNASGDLVLNPDLAASLETVDRQLHSLERQTRPGRLGELIQAAIDYFFGPPKSLPGSGLPGSPQTAPAIGADLWTLAQPPGTGIAPEPRTEAFLSQRSGSQGSGSQSSGSDQPDLPPSPPPSRPARNWLGLFNRDRPGSITPSNGDQAYLDWDPTDDPIAPRRPHPIDDDDWIDHTGPSRSGLTDGDGPGIHRSNPKGGPNWVNPKAFGSNSRSTMGSKSQGSGLTQSHPPYSSTPQSPTPQSPTPQSSTPQSPIPDPHALTPTPPSDPTRDPTLIDTAAKSLGYDRHPLERILNGLDRLLLAIERGLLWIWRSLLNVIGLR